MAEATLYMWTARGMVPAPDQSFEYCWRKNTDYTALERKCQELERERDSAKAELARLRAVETEARECVRRLQQSAQAVLDRWNSPAWQWYNHGPTAGLMAALRDTLAATPEHLR